MNFGAFVAMAIVNIVQMYALMKDKKGVNIMRKVILMAEIKYPYLAYSEVTGCVYIVLNKNKKVDVTSQYEFIVKNKSAADVVEVRHGYWQETDNTPKGQKFACSVYHKTAYFPQPTRDKAWKKQCPYTVCPNCGAKMDGKEN